MALIKCKECDEPMSSSAAACPHCGKRRTSATTKGCMWLIILVAVASVFAYNMTRDQHQAEASRRAALTPEQRALEDAAEAAARLPTAFRGACLIALKRQLNDPGSAQFGSTTGWPVNTEDHGQYSVLATFRAKNAFGAYVLGTWDCKVRAEGTDVRVLSVRQIAP